MARPRALCSGSEVRDARCRRPEGSAARWSPVSRERRPSPCGWDSAWPRVRRKPHSVAPCAVFGHARHPSQLASHIHAMRAFRFAARLSCPQSTASGSRQRPSRASDPASPTRPTMRFHNVSLEPALPASGWRKISLGSWRPTGDSSIYVPLDLDLEPMLQRLPAGVRLTHFVAAVLGRVLSRHRAFNALVRFGRIHPREDVDVFFHVHRETSAGQDLSGFVVRDLGRKSLLQVAAEFRKAVAQVREHDPEMRLVKRRFRNVPGLLARAALNAIGFCCYSLNLPGRLFGAPCDSFGGVMVSNLGSLGVEQAFIPIAPYTRVGLCVAIGAVTKRVRVTQRGEAILQARRSTTLSFTFDHRLGDGFQLSQVLAEVQRHFSNPAEIVEELQS